MRIKWIKYKNFRGLRDLELKCAEGNTDVFWRNGSGKTSIADGYFWVFTDKDSLNQGKFDIKTWNPKKEGESLHNLDHSVEVCVEINGTETRYRKVHKEKWQAKQGAATKSFTGNENEYFINDVPKAEGVFKKEFENVCTEKQFRILSDPSYFPSTLDWKERREALLLLEGDPSIESVVATNDELEDLPGILGDHSPDDYREIVIAAKKKVSAERKAIPERIDEVNRGMTPDEPAPSVNVVELSAKITELQEKRAQAAGGGAVMDKTLEIRQVESDMLDRSGSLRAIALADYEAQGKVITAKNNEADEASATVTRIKSELSTIERIRITKQSEIDSLREKYNEINARTFTFTGVDTCPACNQSLPMDKVQAARDEAEAIFNKQKSEDLAANVDQGRTLKTEIALLDEKKATKTSELSTVKELLVRVDREAMALRTARGNVPDVDFTEDETWKALSDQKAKLTLELDELKSGQSSATEGVDTELRSAQNWLDETKATIQRLERRKSDLARIKELEASQKAQQVEAERLDRDMHLLDEFMKAKVRMIEGNINSHFKITKWKLFHEQLNDGVKPCCEATIAGKPHGTSLSNSERINTGLDIINAFSKHYGISLPVILDNCEGNHDPLPTEGQQIRLWVSKEDTNLRVEAQG